MGAVARMSDEDRGNSTWAKKTCDVLFANEGRNLPGFMVGRQMCVTLCFFIIARVTTIRLNDGDENVFGLSDGAQAFFETGLCQGSWVFAMILRKIAGYKRDEVYIGTSEERSQKKMGDDSAHISRGAGHIPKLPAFAGDAAPNSLKQLMKTDSAVGSDNKEEP